MLITSPASSSSSSNNSSSIISPTYSQAYLNLNNHQQPSIINSTTNTSTLKTMSIDTLVEIKNENLNKSGWPQSPQNLSPNSSTSRTSNDKMDERGL